MVERFDVRGMTCTHCSRVVTAAIKAQDQGASVTIDLTKGIVHIDSRLDRPALEAIIRAEGYEIS